MAPMMEWDGRPLKAGTRVYLTHMYGGRNWERRAGTVRYDGGEFQLHVEWDSPVASDAYPYTQLRRQDWVEKNGGRRLEVEITLPEIKLTQYRQIQVKDLALEQTVYLSKDSNGTVWDKKEAKIESFYNRDETDKIRVRFTSGNTLVLNAKDWATGKGQRAIYVKDSIQKSQDKLGRVWVVWEGQFPISIDDSIQVTSPARNWQNEHATVTRVYSDSIAVDFRDIDVLNQRLVKESFIKHDGGRYISVKRYAEQVENNQTVGNKEESSAMELEISAIKTIDGWHGIVMLDSEIVWQSAPITIDTSKEADAPEMQARNVAAEHLNDKIVGLLA